MIDAWEADLEVDPLWRMACQALKSAQAETLTISSEEDRQEAEELMAYCTHGLQESFSTIFVVVSLI